MKMRPRSMAVFILFSVLFMACGESQTLEWDCSSEYEEKISISKNPYHLTLAILENCGKGKITLHVEGGMINQAYQLSQIGNNKVIYDHDFYAKDLIVKYEPDAPDEGGSSGVVRLKATFH